ncbi:hypothetical protein QR685DRAFT_552547 [Neurospora intermedia]|uniref:ARB-07466-like C-terminal domain-containing protein n=1 Tax=Neurospora intermedia TaxID=5142 RepID=A0ABR3DH74_NEUIN
MSGREIAEWVMNNRSTLNLKYVIRDQKIWNPSIGSVKSWTSWRTMEDRGLITQTHPFLGLIMGWHICIDRCPLGTTFIELQLDGVT